ncbi:hypothetical protein TNCV_724381 [Trichonephila clavipes]|nr:hypothetical protein TNCV_724381 [Trichonephila clavipes]
MASFFGKCTCLPDFVVKIGLSLVDNLSSFMLLFTVGRDLHTVSERRWVGLTRSKETVVFRPLTSMVMVLSVLDRTLYGPVYGYRKGGCVAHDRFLKRYEMKIVVKDECIIDQCRESEQMLP